MNISFLEGNKVNENQKGHLISKAFNYLRQVCRECQRLIFKIDSQMDQEWKNIYGNGITRDVSASLQEPDRWILEAIFRMYEHKKDSMVNKGVNITFWGEDVEEPIITAGKIVYNDISKRNHWDLWNVWFSWNNNLKTDDYKADGTIYSFQFDECPYIKEAKAFSLPLINIKDDKVLMESIITPLIKL